MSDRTPARRALALFLLLVPLGALAGCGWPTRAAVLTDRHGAVAPLDGFADVRAVDGYPSEAFQAAFDRCVAAFAATPVPADGRRDFDMLVLSSGGVNGAFGAGILTAWSQRGDRPSFWTVTGVSVGALMAPFVFAGPEYDDRIEALFRYLDPSDLHREKGVISAVLWDESLMDNSALRRLVFDNVDEQLMHSIADRHAEGRRCWVGSTNLDIGHFCVWDVGAIASRRDDAALHLLRNVLMASAAVPVVYPPIRFSIGDQDELHADGAVVRPMFLPKDTFDGYLSAERAGLDWDDVDATLYVVHNGSLRPRPLDVQRDTLAIATRTVTMMSYTMVLEDVLHLYMLSRAWQAQFRFHTLPDGLDLALDSFTEQDTDRLFLLGQGLMERNEPWQTTPPGYVLRTDLDRIQPGPAPAAVDDSTPRRLERIEAELGALRAELRTLLSAPERQR